MKRSLLATGAAFGLVCAAACSSSGETTSPAAASSGSGSPTSPSDGVTSPDGSSDDAGHSRSPDAGAADSSGPVTCTAPTVAAATLGAVTAAEKGALCDFGACPFGGYGKSTSCAGGKTVKSIASSAICTGDPTWTKCASLAVSDYLACEEKLVADPCNALSIIAKQSACAPLKACAF